MEGHVLRRCAGRRNLPNSTGGVSGNAAMKAEWLSSKEPLWPYLSQTHRPIFWTPLYALWYYTVGIPFWTSHKRQSRQNHNNACPKSCDDTLPLRMFYREVCMWKKLLSRGKFISSFRCPTRGISSYSMKNAAKLKSSKRARRQNTEIGHTHTHTDTQTHSLVPRPRPAFRCFQYSKAGEGLVSSLMWVTSG